ncbi:MAG: O-antigen ligase family protein [Bacteroidota bacterium]
MLKWMIDDKKEVLWVLLHVMLGILSAFSKWPFILWFYTLMISSFILLVSNKNKDLITIKLLVYLLGIEQINRSLGAWPLVPYEIGKYTCIFLVLLGFLYRSTSKGNSAAGVFMLFLGFSGFIPLPADVPFKLISFNYFGPLNLALCMIYFNKQKMTYTQFRELLKILIFPIISFAALIILRQEQGAKVTYGLTANFETSGGTATNQVATTLGFAFAVLGLMFLTGQRLFKIKFLDQILTFIFLFRGLLTFSRGGIITALLALILVLLMPKTRNLWANRQIVFRKIDPRYFIFGAIFMVITFLMVNALTGNFLLLRYQGYNENTIVTNRRNLNNITSNRLGIAESDIAIFVNNPFFGVGIGQSRYWRRAYGYTMDALPHIEVTRMLSEHGTFGLLMAIIFMFYPFYRISKEQSNYNRAVMVVFFTIAVISTFHVAMRTIITPVLYGVACLNLVPDKLIRRNGRSKSDAEEAVNTKEQLELAG